MVSTERKVSSLSGSGFDSRRLHQTPETDTGGQPEVAKTVQYRLHSIVVSH